MERTGKNKLRRQKIMSVLGEIYAVLMYTLFYIPVAVMIVFSFNDAKRNYSWEGFTTDWYRKLFSFSNTTLWDALIYSLVYNLASRGPDTVVCAAAACIPGMHRLVDMIRGKK